MSSNSTCLGPDLLWRNVRTGPGEMLRGALFVDRDGVLIEEKIYLSDPEQVELVPGAVELLREAIRRKIPVIEVTNQAGIAKGKFGWPEFAAVEERLEALLAAQGIRIDAVLACPFHEEGHGVYRVNHPWRKPAPGMILEAASLLRLQLYRSLMVGDKFSDIAAARQAGLPCAVQVLTGHGRDNAEESLSLATPGFRVSVVADPSEAIRHLDEIVPPA